MLNFKFLYLVKKYIINLKEEKHLEEIDPLAIGFRQFFEMSWSLFRSSKDVRSGKNIEFTLSIVKKTHMFDVFEQVNSFKN